MNEQQTNPQRETTVAAATPKKPFAEPAISQPVAVLEATTFFQVVDSGGTGIKKKGGG